MNDIKVTIVIPSKNVEKYIGECLDSIVGQTLKDIEIIVVDADSDDGTREIIQSYMKKDGRIRLLEDDKHSSGYADDLGFDNANGEYVALVESDDYIDTNMMEVMYDTAEKYGADYVKSDFSMFVTVDREELGLNGIQNFSKYNDLNIYDKVINPHDYPELIFLDGYAWNGLYRKDFIKKNNIRFSETKGAAFQDNSFLHLLMSSAKKVVYVSHSFYHYRRDNDNSSVYNPKGLSLMLGEYRYIDNLIKKEASSVCVGK